MKRTQIKDSLRNVRKQIVSFLSVVLIAALGVTLFLAVDYTTVSLRKNGSDLYNRLNYRDVEVISTLLFSGEDLDCIRGLQGVTDAEPLRSVDAKASAGEESCKVTALSLTQRINRMDSVEGRLPASPDECALEQAAAEALGVKPGDRITLQEGESGGQRFLSHTDLTVTGVFNHLDHNNKVVSGQPYVFVTWDAFDEETLQGCFMKVELTVEKNADTDRFSDGYNETVDGAMKRVEELAAARTLLRDGQVRQQYGEGTASGRQKLEEARIQLEDARRLLDEKQAELAKGEAEIADGEAKLADGDAQLKDALARLTEGKAQLDAGKATLETERARLKEGKDRLDSAKAQLDAGKRELETGFAKLEEGKKTVRDMVVSAFQQSFSGDELTREIRWASPRQPDLEDPKETARYLWITENLRLDLSRPLDETVKSIIRSEAVSDGLLAALHAVLLEEPLPVKEDGTFDTAALRADLEKAVDSSLSLYRELCDGCAAWDKGYGEYLAGWADYRDGLALYEEGAAQFAQGDQLFKEQSALYAEGLAEYTRQKAAYDQAAGDLAAGKEQLEEGRLLLAQGEEDYQSGLAEYEKGLAQLTQAEESAASLDPCRWLILNCNSNSSFVQVQLASGNFNKLKMTFGLMFILVGALVIFATVGKMVDEQRSQVGTAKALGFFNREIFLKYLLFGTLATLVGTVLGTLMARFLIQTVMLNGFTPYYVYDLGKKGGHLSVTLAAFVFALLLAVAAVWLASTKLLREPAVRLMSAKVPAANKRRGGGSRLSLYSRLILMNMRSDLNRVLVTIVSVAGCCALVVIGITMRSSLVGATDRQFEEIVHYDMTVFYNSDISEDAEERIEHTLSEAGTAYTKIYRSDFTYQLGILQMGQLYCGDIREIDTLYTLKDWNTGKPLFATNEGILIQRRTAEVFGLDVDSEFEIALGGVKTATVRVAGVFENYLGHNAVMSRGYYETLFGRPPVSNAFMVRLDGADGDALIAALTGIDGYESVERTEDDRSIIASSLSTINLAVILFILVAAIMAAVVQMNLTNMYVLQKKRELTIMRVNGFSVKEAVVYMLRETVVTTLLGIILGIALGSVAASRIVRDLEQPFFQFVRGVCVPAWIVGAVLTLVFTVIVNAVALRKIKYLKLTDVA